MQPFPTGRKLPLRMRPASPTHLVLVPSFNTGPRLASTVADALAVWPDVWVVIDGSTDGSASSLDALAATQPGLRVLHRERNGGKGAAVAAGVTAARAAGFTHALVLDADGQHPIDHIATFMAASRQEPAAMILGQPIFGPEAPLERLLARKLSIGLTHLETLGPVVRDPLFGFRIYPLEPLERALAATRAARGYDFDPEVVVRLFWAGVPAVNLPAPCRYLSQAEGGISHFNYLRDNVKMVWLHLRLLSELLAWRWFRVWRIRRRRAEPTRAEPVPSRA